MTAHLAIYAKVEPGALVFPGAKGSPIRRGNFNKMSAWPQAVASIGMRGLHSTIKPTFGTRATSLRPTAGRARGT